MPEARTSPRRIAAAERRRRALQLKLAGATFEQIARTPTDAANGDHRPLYSSRQRAHEAVQKALKEIQAETRGSAEELRTLELARLESMQMALWPSTRPTKPVSQECKGCGAEVTMYREPDKEAVDRVIKIMERRAKYLGLDVKGIEQDHGKAASMILSIMDALEEGVGEHDFETGAPVPDAGPDE